MKIVDAQLNRMLLDLLRSQQQLFDDTFDDNFALTSSKNILMLHSSACFYETKKKYTVVIDVSLFLLA